jgi:DNA-binding MarR family transcriptional regulator/GNAT superfamily N-acetyltransferase
MHLILSNNHLMKSNISRNPELDRQIAAVRGFSRFYTRKLGIIEPKLLDSPWTLQEARIIYEIAERQSCTATELVRALGLDAGFLSRTLRALQRRQIVARKPSKADRRVTELALTAKGRAAFAELDSRSRSVVAALLGTLDAVERAAVVNAMASIEHALEPPARQPAGFLLRSHRPGDIGWIVSRHGALYAQEYGWDISFEALAAEIAAQFIRSYDPSREHCWIAEIGGEPVGSIFLVKASDEVAKLRLLLVEKKARGLGVGRALTEQCIRFARQAGYSSITLWTQSILVAARGIYQRAGFCRVKEEKHHSFGVDLVGETWELKL